MATQLQLRRGTEAENNAFTGAVGEVTVDTTNNALRVHDGSTQGGFPVANADMTVLSSTGKNIANWSSNVTNCITNIPQDINLTLASGTLTLKAGSKVYVPNGVGVFDEITIASDKTLTSGATWQFMVLYNKTSGNFYRNTNMSNHFSGDTAPENPTDNTIWYDTANNMVKMYLSGAWTSDWSFPLAVVTATGSISSIDQVFNGFGYIGSTVYALPGVKALVPDGRNADGTLKNTIVVKNTVNTFTPSSATFTQATNIALGASLSYHNFIYNEDTNTTSASGYMNAGDIVWTNGKITSFNPKTAFHAVDYSNFTEELDKKADKSSSANTDLSNLTSTGANIGNWSSNVSNCIAEIPQDINLALSNGTLTLKAGAKVYVPNGSDTFDAYTVPSDLTNTPSGFSTSSNRMYVLSPNKTLTPIDAGATYVYSGTTAPTSFDNGKAWWYDTTNNIIKRTADSGSNWESGFSLPIALVDLTNGIGVTAINQVFNGFGFIGAVTYALPGIKFLIPDGRNADGTLNNVVHTTSAVSVLTTAYNATLLLSRVYGIQVPYFTNYADDKNFPTYYTNCEWYNPDTNEMYHVGSGAVSSRTYSCVCCKTTASGGKITSLTVNQPARLVDYSDTDFIAHQAMPSSRYVDLTLGATGSSYTAPADGYYIVSKQSANDNEYITLLNAATNFSIDEFCPASMNTRLFMPVSKGDVIQVNYTTSGTTNYFRFVYANGAK